MNTQGDDLFYERSVNPAVDRVSELRRLIAHHDRLYYDQAKPEITDREYDAL